jgi:HEAT repeat protein
VNTEKDAATRRSFVVSLGQTRQPGTADILLTLAQKDPDSRVRAEAAYYYPQRAGASGISATTAIIEKDPDDNVKRRALSGLGRLPDDQSVPLLINMAKAPNTNPVVRKQAVQILGQSKDPRAVAFLETLVK